MFKMLTTFVVILSSMTIIGSDLQINESVVNQNQSNDSITQLVPTSTQMTQQLSEHSEECVDSQVVSLMTACFVSGFRVWDFNITSIASNGLVKTECNGNQLSCGLKFCCALKDTNDCIQTIAHHLCEQQFQPFVQRLNRFDRLIGCPEELICHSINTTFDLSDNSSVDSMLLMTESTPESLNGSTLHYNNDSVSVKDMPFEHTFTDEYLFGGTKGGIRKFTINLNVMNRSDPTLTPLVWTQIAALLIAALNCFHFINYFSYI